VTGERERPPRLAADVAIAADGARLLYSAGAIRVWLCGSLAHGRHWDETSDLDYVTLGLSDARCRELTRALVDHYERSVDVIRYEDAPSFLRVQINQAMIPVDRSGRTVGVIRGLLDPPATTLTSRPLPRNLHRRREVAVLDVLERAGATDVIDVGCGSGRLVGEIATRGGRATGLEPDATAIAGARDHLSRTLTPEQRERVTLHHRSSDALGSVWDGQDAVSAVEVVEHLEPGQLHRFAALLFETVRPATVVLTTPNADFNAVLPGRGLRDADHRFEWGRDELRSWARDWARAGRYSVVIVGVGEPHPEFGAPSQLCHFARAAS